MSALLKVRDLVKTIGSGEAATRVLRRLSLTLKAGEMEALLRPAGSGKKHAFDDFGHLDEAYFGQLCDTWAGSDRGG